MALCFTVILSDDKPYMTRVIHIVPMILALSLTSAAKDAIKASVMPTGSTVPVVLVNGNPYSVGTYGVGTIQLWYTVTAFSFTPGQFATFQVGLLDTHYGSNPDTAYPVSLTVDQIGSADITLSPVPAVFSPRGPGWTGSSAVTISIPASTAQNPDLNADGVELVGNLRLTTSPEGAQLDTVTNVQVHIKLVHPTSCVRVFDFITDEAFTTLVNSTQVNANGNKVNSTNPYGQFSDNVLVANTCAVAHSFDLQSVLDSSFETSPHGNPGNAVFTYFKTGYVDPNSFQMSAFGTGTPAGEQLCVHNVNLPGGNVFLMTIHMGIIKGMSPASLPASGSFGFSASLYGAGSNCSGPLDGGAAPNPAANALAFTITSH